MAESVKVMVSVNHFASEMPPRISFPLTLSASAQCLPLTGSYWFSSVTSHFIHSTFFFFFYKKNKLNSFHLNKAKLQF